MREILYKNQDQDFTMKFVGTSYSSYTKVIHKIWCRSTKFLWKSKFRSGSGFGSGSWFYFGLQYQTYISYIEDTHQIFFGSANSFETFFGLFRLLRHTNHEHSSKGENFFFHSCDYNTFSFYILRMWWENNITILAIHHSKIYFVDTFGEFSHTVEWNSLKSVWQISLYTLT